MLWQLISIRDVMTDADKTDLVSYHLLGNIFEVLLHEGRMVLSQYGQWVLRSSPVQTVVYDVVDGYCIYTTAHSEYRFLLANKV